jgi:hypothetical protein
MSGEIVSEVNGHIVFGDAVARIAGTLSPLGAAARIVAEAGAVGVELRRLTLAGRSAEAGRLEEMLRLEHRRAAVGETIRDLHETVSATEPTARRLRECIENAQREVLRRGVPVAEKEIYRDILRDFTARLIGNRTGGGHVLTGHIREVLNGTGAPAPAPPRRGRPPPGQPGGRDDRPRRRGPA